MNRIAQSLATVQYRLGMMSDAALQEITVAPRTRDIFCDTDFAYGENKNVTIGIVTARKDKSGMVSPAIIHSPLLTKYATNQAILKAVAHEGGHYLNRIANDTAHPVTLATLGMGISMFSYGVKIGMQVYDDIRPEHRISRRNFFKRATHYAGTAAIVTYGSRLTASYYDEYDADHKADAIVPETTIGATLEEMADIFSHHTDDPDAPTRQNKDMPLILLSSALSYHPAREKRAARSIQNCAHFAKNAQLWESSSDPAERISLQAIPR